MCLDGVNHLMGGIQVTLKIKKNRLEVWAQLALCKLQSAETSPSLLAERNNCRKLLSLKERISHTLFTLLPS